MCRFLFSCHFFLATWLLVQPGAHAEQLGHLVVQEAFARLIGLDPLKPSRTNCGMPRLPVWAMTLSAAPGVVSMLISVKRNRVRGEKALGLPAVAAPIGRIDKKIHAYIVADMAG